MSRRFHDREDAGQQLAERLATSAWPPPLVVLALPRGGVPVAAVVARRLGAPLDLLLVRKIGSPWNPELAVAAVVDAGAPELVVDAAIARSEGADDAYIRGEMRRQWELIVQRRQRYLSGRAPVDVQGATVIVVDDGIATGTTVRAALAALRRRGAARIVLAVPVAPRDTLARLRAQVDDIVCLAEPSPFLAIGLHYGDFHQVGDDEVLEALRSCETRAASEPPSRGAGPA